MRILNNDIVDGYYDVVVVGAGIGGLTAASLLAHRGLKVLAVEQHYLPGGCCSAIRRRDIAFDVGAALLFGFGERGYNPHRYVMNELQEEIDMIRHESIMRVNFHGKKVDYWLDFNRYFKELVAAFPHEEKGLQALYRRLQKVFAGVIASETPAPPTEINWRDGMKGFFHAPFGTMQLGPLMFKTTRSLLAEYVSDPDIFGFFDMLTATMFCCTTAELPALLSAVIMVDAHIGGACYPAGSPQMLPNKLEKALERHGGQILYRHLVDEILIEDGVAQGVRLDDGTTIKAGRVVSNATIWNLYGKLIRPAHLKPSRLRWAQAFIPTFSVMVLYVGVDKAAVPPERQPIEMFANDLHDLTASNTIVYIPSLDDPSICPPDAHSLTILSPVDEKCWPPAGSPFYRSEDYNELKKAEADKILKRLEAYFPNLKQHIRVLEIATPSTIERFTLRKNGCVGGPKQIMGQELMRRPRARSEIKNLYLCGDSTVMGEGVVATTSSGVGAANMILRDLDLEEYRPRRHSRQFINMVRGEERAKLPSLDDPVTEKNAKRLAMECQLCEDPGCRNNCPAGIDALNFIRRIEAGNFIGAVRAVRAMNPFAEVCGRICPAERFCEKNCKRLDFDTQPSRIRELHGWVAASVSKFNGWPRYLGAHNGHKVGVVGAGPAGMTCAHFLARLGFSVDIYEKRQKPGGMLTHALPEFRLPDNVVARELEGMTLPGMSFKYGQALGAGIDLEKLQAEYDAVFLAPGLWRGRTLELPGLKKGEITDALSFLLEAREHGTAKTGRQTLVIGGGSVAADVVLAAKACGAREVTLVCLEQEHEMPCLPAELKEMKEKGVTIKNGWGPQGLTAAGEMSFNCCTRVFDQEGTFRPAFNDKKTLKLNFDRVIMAVGQTTESELGSYLKRVFGYEDKIKVSEETREIEGHPGIYAGGDIVRGAGTVVQAVGDGRSAARAIADSLL